jgi:hypothetical protein
MFVIVELEVVGLPHLSILSKKKIKIKFLTNGLITSMNEIEGIDQWYRLILSVAIADCAQLRISHIIWMKTLETGFL